jgi:sugar phosphate isomerase/epimerase
MATAHFRLAGFADEISADLNEQIRVCKELGVTHFELRGVYGKNVLDFDGALRAEIKAKLGENGLGVASIGSPVGKVAISDPWEGGHELRYRIAVESAEYFGAPLIRLFSYYDAKDGTSVLQHRDEVLRRFRAKVAYLESRPSAKGVTLVHENEAKIYGEKGERCHDLMTAINSPRLRMAFDFANFVQAGERPLDNWPSLKPFSVHIHVKDAMLGTGKVVPAGEGDGQVEPILVDLARTSYDGFLSLEPHLAAHGQFAGFSGPELFRKAADALKGICRRHGLPLAGL